MSKVKITALALLSITSINAAWAQKSKPKKKVATHSSRNSLDWAGTYSNGLVSLNLFDDNSYYYKNGNLLTSGNFSWAANGNSITLLGTGEQFKIHEGNLKNMSNGTEFIKDGNNSSAENAGTQKKVKINSKLIGGKWILIELKGKKIEPAAEGRKQPYIAFDQKDGTFSGNGGCNGFGGSMKAMDDFKIEFGGAMQTMMACLGDDIMLTESGLHQAIKAADNYTIKDGILSLNKARMAPLARFKFVADQK